MKLKALIVLGVALAPVSLHAEAEKPLLSTPQDMINYTIGVNFINNLRQQGVDVNLDLVVQGMRDAQANKGLLLPDQDLHRSTIQYQTMVRQKMAARARENAREKNKKSSEDYLISNGKKDGVVTLPSGLQYWVVTMGKGKKPAQNDIIEYTLRGTLISGREFISTLHSGKPAINKLNDIQVPGFRDALKLMPAGSKWQVTVPPALAFGEKGQEPVIGPNQVLIYDIELLSVKHP